MKHRPFIIALVAGTAIGCSASHVLAQAADQPRPMHRWAADKSPTGAAPFNIRWDKEGLPTAAVRASLDRLYQTEAWAERNAAVRALEARVRGVKVDEDGFLGAPGFIRSTSAFLTAPSKNDAVTVVADFVTQNAAIFGFDGGEVLKSRVSRDFVTAHNGVRHLTFQQTVNGVDLFGCLIRTNVMPDGRLINIGGTMIPPVSALPAVKISPRDAIVLAAATVGIDVRSDLTPAGAAEGASLKQTWNSAFEFRDDEPIVSELVAYPVTRDDIRAAWKVVIPQHGTGHTYDALVDAQSGQLLWRENRLVNDTTQPITFRVWPKDSPTPGSPGTPTPSGFQFAEVPRDLLVVTPDMMRPFSPNGWINDNENETIGNNVAAHLDRDSSANSPDLPRPSGPGRVFDFPIDINQSPTLYGDFAVTQMFYYSNVFHDRLYELGFDEVAGNFQTDNFGRGGIGNDAVLADGQDGGGTNNANFSTTGVDGSTSRMQMYIFTGPNPDRDGTIDGDIVYHELGHGVSIRLHGGLSGTQPRAQGEAWSDFFALTLNSEPGDDPRAVYAMGGYATLQLASTFFDNYYFGIRRFPYSTDMNIAPQTFADIDTAQQNFDASIPRSPVIGNTANQVHNAGETWCNTLWDCRANLIDDHGYDGNQIMLQLVVDGMKLAPGDPNFLQSRDAILQADMVNNASANTVSLWRGFAKRGMGASATSPVSSTTSGIVEAFDIPNRVIFALNTTLPEFRDPGSTLPISVTMEPFNLDITANTARMHVSIDGGTPTVLPMTAGANNVYTAVLPGAACFEDTQFFFTVETSIGTQTFPAEGLSEAFTIQTYTGIETTFNDTFETDQGWTVTSTATDGQWTRGVPVNGGRNDPPADFDGSGRCWVTDNVAGNSDVDNGSTTLTSPVFSTPIGYALGYAYWFDGNPSAGDSLTVQYSDNGGAWTTVREYTTAASAWRVDDILVGQDLPQSNSMRVRFIATDSGVATVVEAGLDAFRIWRRVCEDTTCPADWDGSGGVDGDDIGAFFTDWQAGNADIDQSGGTDGDDITYFFERWQAGC